MLCVVRFNEMVVFDVNEVLMLCCEGCGIGVILFDCEWLW